jgi:hypothetical protein
MCCFDKLSLMQFPDYAAHTFLHHSLIECARFHFAWGFGVCIDFGKTLSTIFITRVTNGL